MTNDYARQKRIEKKLAESRNRTSGFPNSQRTMPYTPSNPSFKTYKGFRKAIGEVYEGLTNSDCYNNLAGINRDRLRVAQSLRDLGISRPLRKITKMNWKQIEEVCGIF